MFFDGYVELTAKGTVFDMSQKSDVNNERIKIEFNLLKTSDSKPNNGSITVYNIAQQIMDEVITATETNDASIKLFFGYQEQEVLQFSGLINNAYPDKTDLENLKFIFQIGDGQLEYNESLISQTFSDGTKIDDIVKIVSKKLGLVVSKEATISERAQGALSAFGSASEFLNELSKAYDFDWSIQENEIQITKKNESLGGEAKLIDVGNGLLNYPEKTTDGVNIEVLPIANFTPKELIKLVCDKTETQTDTGSIVADGRESLNGFYTVKKVNFLGSNYDDFQMKLELVPNDKVQ